MSGHFLIRDGRKFSPEKEETEYLTQLVSLRFPIFLSLVTAAAARSIKFESNSIRYGPNQLAALSRMKKNEDISLFLRAVIFFHLCLSTFSRMGMFPAGKKKDAGRRLFPSSPNLEA